VVNGNHLNKIKIFDFRELKLNACELLEIKKIGFEMQILAYRTYVTNFRTMSEIDQAVDRL